MNFRVVVRSIAHSSFSEYFIDALRNTLAVLAPIVLFFNLGETDKAIGMGVGALLICLTDLPGNRFDKWWTAFVSNIFFFFTAAFTAYCLSNYVLLFVFSILLTFVLTMLNAMGTRMGSIGMMSLILMIFTIGLQPQHALHYAIYILLGGLWYYTLSLAQIYIYPYRSLNRALHQCQRQTAALLKLRAEGYNPDIGLSRFNERNIRLHLKISNLHELVRQLLLGDKRTLRSDKIKTSILLSKASHLIDLYEQVSAVHYDYPFLRKKLDKDLLLKISRTIFLQAQSLSSLQLENGKQERRQLQTDLQQALKSMDNERKILLSPILINLLKIEDLLIKLCESKTAVQFDERKRLSDFLPNKDWDWTVLNKHLTYSSPIFRYSLRLSILCALSMGLLLLFSNQTYGYWLLLTLVIVSRPSYWLTMKRHWERVFGTFLGLVIGYLGLHYLPHNQLLMSSAFLLFGFFMFNKPNYLLSVVCITALVLMILNLYQGGMWDIASNRLLFTLLGSFLCVLATFIFPIWNAPQLKNLAKEVLAANYDYFLALSIHNFQDEGVDSHQLRLLRKRCHVQLRLLSEQIQAAQKEPFFKKMNWALINRFQVLNYQFNVLCAAKSQVEQQSNKITESTETALVKQVLKKCMAKQVEFNWHTQVVVPKWDDKPMDILATAKRILQLLSLPDKPKG